MEQSTAYASDWRSGRSPGCLQGAPESNIRYGSFLGSRQPDLQLTILASLQRVFVRRRSRHPSAEAARSQELGNRCVRAMPPHSVTSRTLLDGRWARMERRAIPVPFSLHEPSAARRERRARTRLRHGTAIDFGGKVRAESGRDGPHCVMLA